MSLGLGSERGVRMDNKNHNWIILEEYLALPFSYMSFVIKHFIESTPSEQREEYVFDVEPYNYLLNRSSSFLDSNFVKSDPTQLHEILNNFDLLDKTYLELLHYAQKVSVTVKSDELDSSSNKYASPQKGVSVDIGGIVSSGLNKVVNLQQEESQIMVYNSPLHMAIREGNNKSVDTILLYMSKIDMNASRQFRDIFDKLIMFQNMKQYINRLPHTTNQMRKKQVLKVSNSHSDEIIKMEESNSIYVDNKFYRESMGENVDDPSYSSFPVKVVALRMGWMLKSEDHQDGYFFLCEILRNEDLSWYNLQSLRMIIEFLYTKIKYAILCLLLPCYIINQILFVTVALVNETLRTKYEIDKENNIVKGNEESKQWSNILIWCLVLNLCSVLIQTFINYFMFKMMGMRYFKRVWSWIDMTILVISFAILAYFFAMVSKVDDKGYFYEKYDEYKF